MSRKGILTVVSGFSGAGKGTIMKLLIQNYDQYALSISATTRQPREGEVDGREYFFHTVESFETMIEQSELIEYAKYVNNYYGTPRRYVEEQLNQGKDVILEIEIQGALKVRNTFPDALLLFVTPPAATDLKCRLESRGTENAETIAARLNRAVEESVYMDQYDYLIINDDLKISVENVHQIIQNEHHKVDRNKKLIHKIREELKCFSKGE